MTTPAPAPTIAPPLTAEAEQKLRDEIADKSAWPSLAPWTVRSLLASLDEARKDSKRLDWLESKAIGWANHGTSHHAMRGIEYDWFSGETLRESLDAAMSKKGSQ